MPKNPINYSKCLIYKIVCNDLNITDSYVGHTTDLVKRRYEHKTTCNNPTNPKYHYKVYQYIRNNGGWDNWLVVLVEEYPCDNINQACKRERHWIEELKASLNMSVPSRTQKEWCYEHREELKEYRKEY